PVPVDPPGRLDLMSGASTSGFHLTGIDALERYAGRTWRWLLGPSSCAERRYRADGPTHLTYAFRSPIPDQRVQVRLGEEILATHGPLNAWQTVRNEISLQGAQLVGAPLCFETSLWAQGAHRFAERDSRPLSLELTTFTVVTELP